MSATVNSISVKMESEFPLGMMQGFMTSEHRVPKGYRVVRMTFCQNCGRLFTSKESSQQKYCGPCCARYLLPVDFGCFLDAAPDHTHLERDLPHYDLPTGKPS